GSDLSRDRRAYRASGAPDARGGPAAPQGLHQGADQGRQPERSRIGDRPRGLDVISFAFFVPDGTFAAAHDRCAAAICAPSARPPPPEKYARQRGKTNLLFEINGQVAMPRRPLTVVQHSLTMSLTSGYPLSDTVAPADLNDLLTL